MVARIMNILFVSDAIAPLSGNGAAARVCSALPKALKALDHQPFVLSPLYQGIDPTTHSLARRLTKLTYPIAGQDWSCALWTGRTIGGSELVFIGHETLFQSVPRIDEGDEAAVALRTGAFIRSALTLLERNEAGWEAIHGHGWLGAAVIAAAKAAGIGLRTVLTVHDTTETQMFSGEHAVTAGLAETAPADSIDPLKAGLAAADVVTVTSSSTDLSTLGFDDEALVASGGIDGATWNTLTDPELSARFDPVDLDGKAQCKGALQKELGFPERNDAPLLVALGGSDPADGLDLLAKCTSMLLRNDIQLLVGVTGECAGLTAAFGELADRWPDRLQFRNEVEAGFIHRALGGADIALLASPDGSQVELVQAAQRYGAVPVARAIGAHGEAIVDADASLATGTGILFDEVSSDGVLGAARRAVAAFASDGFEPLRRRVMRLDVSWDRSARLFERQYATPNAD